MLQARQLEVRRGSSVILQGVDLHLHMGKMTGV